MKTARPAKYGEIMGKTKLMLLGALLVSASTAFAAPQPASATGISKYELQRNLPAPDAGSRWTYMGGNYVLITEPEGKILKIYDGEIFYHR